MPAPAAGARVRRRRRRGGAAAGGGAARRARRGACRARADGEGADSEQMET